MPVLWADMTGCAPEHEARMYQCCRGSPNGVHAAGIEWPENPQLARCLARN